jgi:hypothetical protein
MTVNLALLSSARVRNGISAMLAGVPDSDFYVVVRWEPEYRAC